MVQWGDVPAWAAVAISAGAAYMSWRTRRANQRATARFDTIEESLERMADNAEKQTAAQLSATTLPPPPRFIERAPRRPLRTPPVLPEFNVEYVRGHAYRLRNVSTATATDVTVRSPGDHVAANLPDHVELKAGRSSEPFVIQGTLAASAPGEVLVTCTEIDGETAAALPVIP